MNAFQGIFRRYRGTIDGQSSSFCYGLPISAFDQTFCWRSYKHSPQSRNVSFPSWSWLGWQGGVLFDRHMIKAARTNQIIYSSGYFGYEEEGQYKLRKPASSYVFRGSGFGFPAAMGSQFYNHPQRHIIGSVTTAIVSGNMIEHNGSNGLYSVFVTSCRHELSADIETIDVDTRARQRVSFKSKDESNHDGSQCDEGACSVETALLGYIWLDQNWRVEQGGECFMDFMALAGKRDDKNPGQWIITMLMCLQRMEKNGQFCGHERVQVMDCLITEQNWLELQAISISIVLI